MRADERHELEVKNYPAEPQCPFPSQGADSSALCCRLPNPGTEKDYEVGWVQDFSRPLGWEE